MGKFSVITGGIDNKIEKQKKIKKKKEERYKELYYEFLYYSDAKDKKRAAFYGVKYVVFHNINTETSYRDMLQFMMEINEITKLLETLTYKDMLNIFPVIKDFDGWKWESKDYWSTMEYLKTKNISEQLGEEADEFLWTYYNLDIMNFGIKKTLVFDRLLRFDGKQGLLEGFLDKVDPYHTIHTYTVHEKEGYIYDRETGKTSKLVKPKKKIPKQFQVI